MLKSDLCDFSDAYIVVKGTITVTNPNNDVHDKKLAFKNNALFIACISKVNNTLIDNLEDLDIAMLVYNYAWMQQKIIQKRQKIFEITTKMNHGGAVGNINYSIKDSKSFDYKTSIAGVLENSDTKNVEIVVR